MTEEILSNPKILIRNSSALYIHKRDPFENLLLYIVIVIYDNHTIGGKNSRKIGLVVSEKSLSRFS